MHVDILAFWAPHLLFFMYLIVASMDGAHINLPCECDHSQLTCGSVDESQVKNVIHSLPLKRQLIWA